MTRILCLVLFPICQVFPEADMRSCGRFSACPADQVIMLFSDTNSNEKDHANSGIHSFSFSSHSCSVLAAEPIGKPRRKLACSGRATPVRLGCDLAIEGEPRSDLWNLAALPCTPSVVACRSRVGLTWLLVWCRRRSVKSASHGFSHRCPRCHVLEGKTRRTSAVEHGELRRFGIEDHGVMPGKTYRGDRFSFHESIFARKRQLPRFRCWLPSPTSSCRKAVIAAVHRVCLGDAVDRPRVACFVEYDMSIRDFRR